MPASPLAFDKVAHNHRRNAPLIPPDRERETAVDKPLFVMELIPAFRLERVWATGAGI